MIQEGFYNNVNVKTPFREIGDILCRVFRESAETEASIRKYIPNPIVKIDPQYILTVASSINPEVSYSFDLKDTIKKIYDFIIAKMDDVYVDINHLDSNIWKDINTTTRIGYGFITASIRASKGEIILSVTGNRYNDGIFKSDSTYKLLTSTDTKNYSCYDRSDFIEYFKDKLILSEPIKSNSVSVCMDLRTYLTKAINGLHDGSLTSIQVKKNIEDYIKKL